LEAIDRLRRGGLDVVLDVAGSGDEAYAATLAAQVRALGLDSVVHFVGFATGARKSELFASADVFALPAYDENFGISVAEAMAHGLPVVISDGVGLAEHVRAAGAGRVCPVGDAAALAEALRELVPPRERAACGERAAALVARELSIPVMAERLLAEYHRAVAAGIAGKRL
jgi:glycosyltransferase involved in cell wall biosynthesis